MEVIPLRPRGFCKGVVRALQLAKQARLENPEQDITILGSLVHNRFVVQALQYYNIKTVEDRHKQRIDLLEEITEGIVIFSAHGVSTAVKKRAAERGLIALDATCEDVASTQQLIEDYLTMGREVIYVGKALHPESLAIIESYPEVHFISDIKQVEQLKLSTNCPFVSNQTTLSTLQLEAIFDALVQRYPLAEITNEICAATRFRQLAVLESHDLDALIVVGDPHSNNTQMLASIGQDKGIAHVFRYESIEDLDLSQFNKSWRVGITSGASTPTYLTNQLIEYLTEVNLDFPHPKPEVDLQKIL